MVVDTVVDAFTVVVDAGFDVIGAIVDEVVDATVDVVGC